MSAHIVSRPIFEVGLFVAVVALFASLRLPLESSDIFILPFFALVLLRLVYLIKKGEVSLKNDIFNFKGSSKAILYFGSFSVLATLVLWLLKDVISMPFWLSENTWFMLVHTLIQQIIFRVYLVNRLKLVLHSPWLIALSAGTIFAGAHLIMPDIGILLPLLFVAGTVWAYLYQKYPNVLYLWLSHLAIDASIHFLYPL